MSLYLKRKLFRFIFPVLVGGVLTACGGDGDSGNTDPVLLTPDPAPINQAPVFSSLSSAEVEETMTESFYELVVSDPDGDVISRLELLSDLDARFFQFDALTGALSPAVQFDFEIPNDANSDNVYNLSFEAEDSEGAISTFDLSVTVVNLADEASFGLQAGLPPSGNFDLLDWKLDLPVDDDGKLSGDSATIDEDDLAEGYQSEWFFTGADGGLVLKAPPGGATTSSNTRYARTELREMLRRGDRSIKTRGEGDLPNKNNWALSSQPESAQADAGGIDGTLRVSLAVNSVTTTGENFQIGRLVIGQIHAKDDEPIRLYYRKLPDNPRGAIYAVHEISGGDDIDYDIIGSPDNSASNPSDGILLDEIFEYVISTQGNSLNVTINSSSGTELASTLIDMSKSGYDVEDDFMYFKAGVYHLNDSADEDEFAQITIYALENEHEGYNP